MYHCLIVWLLLISEKSFFISFIGCQVFPWYFLSSLYSFSVSLKPIKFSFLSGFMRCFFLFYIFYILIDARTICFIMKIILNIYNFNIFLLIFYYLPLYSKRPFFTGSALPLEYLLYLLNLLKVCKGGVNGYNIGEAESKRIGNTIILFTYIDLIYNETMHCL